MEETKRCPMIYGEEMCLTPLVVLDEGTPEETRHCPYCKVTWTMDSKEQV